MPQPLEPSRKGPARVLIVDDHPAVREGLAGRIECQPDLEVCGEAADVAEALGVLETTRPDVAVIDISLRSGNGIDLIERIKARDASLPILVWSLFQESLYAQRALRAGALGYVGKDEATGTIVEAIRTVLGGKVYLSPEMAEKILYLAVGDRGELCRSPIESLSNRELEVFRLIGSGLTTGEIADRLRLSVHTIETHRQRIKAKLRLKTTAELGRAAVQWVLEDA